MPAPMRRLESIVTIAATLNARTGLRIGATESGIMIGGSDNPVIRDPVTKTPYVPGSSLKGKMRSLLERRHGLESNSGPTDTRVHACQPGRAGRPGDNYAACPVCPVFGIPARPSDWFSVTRVGVADAFLTDGSRQALEKLNTDLPFTEVKSEATIDRVTSAATPRTMERVPAGAEFGPVRISLQRYAGDPFGHIERVLEGMELLEADYLGGGGSRGSGRVEFSNIGVEQLRFPEGGETERRGFPRPLATLRDALAAEGEIESWLTGT